MRNALDILRNGPVLQIGSHDYEFQACGDIEVCTPDLHHEFYIFKADAEKLRDWLNQVMPGPPICDRYKTGVA